MEEDIIEMETADFDEVEQTSEIESEEGDKTVTKEESKTNEETPISDENKLLEMLNDKIVYNGNKGNFTSLEDIVANIQKGMNYDKLNEKKTRENEDEEEVLNFIREKSKGMNMTSKEYISKVREYEENQKKAKQEESIQKMIENGVDSETARRVATVEAYMDELKHREEKLKEQEEQSRLSAEKDKEFNEFLAEYPGIDVKSIPQEVFEEAKSTNMLTAYRKYENKLLKEKLSQIEQNQKNASSSIVKPISSANEESKDAFLLGFDSE